MSTTEDRRPLVIVTRALPDGWLNALDGLCEIHTGPADRAGIAPELEPHLPEAKGILCMLTERVDAALLDRMPKLEVVSNMAVGVDNIDVEACTRRKVPVGHTPGVLTDATADLTMGLLISAARRLPEASKDAREGRWTIWSPTDWLGEDLRGATLGIVGLGKIGAAVAERAIAFGMRILCATRTTRPDLESRLGARRVALDTLLEQSDFVSLHVPLGDGTRHLIGEAQLHRMKPSAILVNAARGPVVDSRALHGALAEGWIAGAALDVTDPEPLPPTDPLYALPNCLIAPHVGSATRGTRRRMADLAAQNLLAGVQSRMLPHCVNPGVYEGEICDGRR
jgi:lactate dehydrogenase-like 2-hydroxyacid dehydrogenase